LAQEVHRDLQDTKEKRGFLDLLENMEVLENQDNRDSLGRRETQERQV